MESEPFGEAKGYKQAAAKLLLACNTGGHTWDYNTDY
jgi:hypothetical protein